MKSPVRACAGSSKLHEHTIQRAARPASGLQQTGLQRTLAIMLSTWRKTTPGVEVLDVGCTEVDPDDPLRLN